MRPAARRRIRRLDRRGIALMEVIIGGIMLSVGLTAVLSLASRSISAQGLGERRVTASWLIDEMLSMVLVEGPVMYPKLHDTSGRFEAPFDAYQFEVDLEDQGIGEPFLVTATVRWSQGGALRQASAQTYISDRDEDPFEERAPLEPIDRIGRWYDDE